MFKISHVILKFFFLVFQLPDMFTKLSAVAFVAIVEC